MTIKPTPINRDAINPDLLLEHMKAEQGVNHLFAVTFTERGHQIWCAGDLSHLAIAQLVLHDLAIKYANQTRTPIDE